MKKLRAKMKKQGGFTLIEMLIVVAIIAILIAIAIPMVNKALERAREATDQANMRAAIGLAYVEYLAGDTVAGNTYYYKIDNTKGSLDTTKPTTGYGKGTALGPDTTPHIDQVIELKYNATTGDVTGTWVDIGTTPP